MMYEIQAQNLESFLCIFDRVVTGFFQMNLIGGCEQHGWSICFYCDKSVVTSATYQESEFRAVGGPYRLKPVVCLCVCLSVCPIREYTSHHTHNW